MDDALLCCDEGADLLGFIFYRGSKRYVSPEKAMEIIRKLPAGIQSVGVFVNESGGIVNEIATALGLAFAQLHGDETPDYARTITAPVLKAFRVSDNFDFSIVDSYLNVVPLFDTFSRSAYGGTGKTFSWINIPEEFRSRCFLSGGISSENVVEAIENIKPFAIDVSSSIEAYPGKKDAEIARAFFAVLASSRDNN